MFADGICKVVGYPADEIQYDTSRYVGAKSKCLNVEKIKEAVPEFELQSLDVGLNKTIEWFYETQAYKVVRS